MPANVKFYHEILSWFNVSHNTLINLSPEQILMQKYVRGPVNDNLRRRLDLLTLFIKKHVYTCKVNVVPLNCTQFIVHGPSGFSLPLGGTKATIYQIKAYHV